MHPDIEAPPSSSLSLVGDFDDRLLKLPDLHRRGPMGLDLPMPKLSGRTF
jgi:hypothetical protein